MSNIPEAEFRFCRILWAHGPMSAKELTKLSQEQLGWKRTTTYTVIKRLGERGVLKLENGIVTALISQEEAEASEIEDFVERNSAAPCPHSWRPSPGGRTCPKEIWRRSSG